KSALIFVLGSCGEIQAFLLDDSNPGRHLAGDGGNAAVNIVSGLARAKRQNRKRHERHADVAHSAPAANTDAAEVLLLELRENYCKPLINRPGVVAHFAQ